MQRIPKLTPGGYRIGDAAVAPLQFGVRRARWIPVAILSVAMSSVRATAGDTSFRNDVMAVLSKAGCNQGACHGNANGKNGFKLSLRGEDPDWDLAALTHDTFGRRVNRLDPASSLILLKATGRVPHEGGRRFESSDPEYKILSDWLLSGAVADGPGVPKLESLDVRPRVYVATEPNDSVQLQVLAAFSDGSTQDVTRMACYEPADPWVAVTPAGRVHRNQLGETSIVVRYLGKHAAVRLAFIPARADFQWPDVPAANYIDTHVFNKLRTLRIVPSDRCSDSVFLRRAYLDCLGVLPTPSEVRRFLADNDPDKRAKLIDQLLERPEFADFWALKWSDLLRNEEKTLDRKGVQSFHRWIRESIAVGRPLNEFARDLLAARGSTYTNPAANFYRANRTPFVRAETTAQVFLGLRLQCARCHNHPFDRWTMDDYYNLSSFFARVQYKVVENNRKDGLDQHEFDGEQVVWWAREGEVLNPRTGVAAVRRLPVEPVSSSAAPHDDSLRVLADWVARSDNPFFARAQVNRIWYHMMGRGVVDPIDDFRDSNPPVNPELLDALAADFVSHGFDLRHCIRTIMNSRTYQASAVPNETNGGDELNFSRALVRPIQAEVLLDAYSSVTGVPVKFGGYPLGMRAGSLPGVMAARRRGVEPEPGDEFLRVFGKPERLLACECERSDDTTLGQAFQLISGETIHRMLSEGGGRLSELLDSDRPDRAVVEELFLAGLSRYPSDGELAGSLALIGRSGDRRAAFEDLLWGLLNAKEFLLRR